MSEKRMWREAESHLRERGWTSVLSACVSGPTREYGTLFCRDGQDFWLNIETVSSLPPD
jgi:hypothetical protein